MLISVVKERQGTLQNEQFYIFNP